MTGRVNSRFEFLLFFFYFELGNWDVFISQIKIIKELASIAPTKMWQVFENKVLE